VPARPNPLQPPPSAEATTAFMQRYTAVMLRASQDRGAVARSGAQVPDDVKAALQKLNAQQQAVGMAMRTRDYAAGEQGLRDIEETLAVIEKFVGK